MLQKCTNEGVVMLGVVMLGEVNTQTSLKLTKIFESSSFS